ncbi:LLM class F420-dependent oxidoreductase [Homoserinibacter sp. GY 40078]|uniref:LLM class F420-dependent oxidoreductase n=1 Tax=Homoserinibacter sp. GY 40078 TaxID=2603275 RepID=UPI0011CAADB0|nr:LLM class F420-dependent oxidoreductase [Homoserinibacter sp. GY 40078]TXK18999.1 LLM class F420-dependent oxidoreductase [Homoserinibacter sp. GY 40078]
MRFGIFIPQGWRFDLVGIDPARHWGVMHDLARSAEEGPWESIWIYDHFHTTPVPSDEATHEAWTLMSALAASTSRVRLGQMCTCVGYRNPAYLAKVASTVDIISGGRVEMGIGAGWYEHEWRAYGYGFPDAPARLRMLREGVEVMHQAWTTGSASLDGEFWKVDGAIVQPQPLQEGGIPMWIAGGGEKVTLKIAAQYASYTNFNGGAESFAHKSEVLRQHCETLGTDFDAITRSSNFATIVGETSADVHRRVDNYEARLSEVIGDAKAAEVVAQYRSIDSNEGIAGTPDEIIEVLRARQALGLGYSIHYFPESAYDRSGVALFEEQVIPALS